MAQFGNGYGTECHLLRYLGRHRTRLDAAISDAVGASDIRWLDFPLRARRLRSSSAVWPDAEWRALDFLPPDHSARQAWRDFWPVTGETLNWDAIAVATIAGREEWLLFEAKAHLQELFSRCGAKEEGGLPKIGAAFDLTRHSLGVDAETDWLGPYYQYCNRIAALDFLTRNEVPARLILIYFTGDQRPDAYKCPADANEWQPALSALSRSIGLPTDHPLKQRIHNLFLPVAWKADSP